MPLLSVQGWGMADIRVPMPLPQGPARDSVLGCTAGLPGTLLLLGSARRKGAEW